jgi:hypothetical protein
MSCFSSLQKSPCGITRIPKMNMPYSPNLFHTYTKCNLERFPIKFLKIQMCNFEFFLQSGKTHLWSTFPLITNSEVQIHFILGYYQITGGFWITKILCNKDVNTPQPLFSMATWRQYAVLYCTSGNHGPQVTFQHDNCCLENHLFFSW